LRKFLSKGFVKGFLVLFGVCVSLLLIIQAPPLKRKALEWVIESALNEPNHQVKIEGIGGFFPFSLHASKCIMNDKNGTWMELKGIDASLKVFPSRGYFSLDSLNLYRPPILEFPSKISLMDVFSALIGQTSIRSFVIKQIQIDSSIWGKTYEANLLLTPDNQDGQKISLKSSVEGVAQKTIKVEVVINRALSKKEKISIEQLEFSQEEKFIVKGKALLDIALPLVKAETDLSVTLLSNKDVNNSFNFVTNLIYDVKKKNLTLKGEADKFSILGAWGEEFFGKKLQWSIHADLQNTNDIIVESLNLSSDKGHFLQGEARFSTIQLQGKFTTSLASHDVLKENKSPIIFETVLSGNLTKPVLKTHVNLPEVVPFHIKDAEIMADFGHTDFWTFHLQALGQGAKIDIKVDHHPDLKKTGIQVNADADNFEPWFKGIVPVHLEANLDENLTGTITGLVKGIKLGSLSLMQTDLSMVLKEGRGEFDLKSIQRVSRKKKTAVPILVSRGEVNFKNSALLIKEIKLTPGTHIISLDRPCLIDFKNVSVDQLELSIAQGKIKVEKFNCASCTENQTHQVWSGQISINNVPLSILQIFESSLAMSGEINGHAQLFGEQFFPEIKGQLKVSDVTYEPFAEKQSQSLKKVNGEIDFNWLSNSLDWKIRGHAEPALTFTSDGKITLLNGRIQSSSQVQMQLKGSLHLGVFSAFLGGGDRIDGILTTDLTVAGNVEKPFLKGSVQLDNGLYEIADFGTMIHNITLRAEAKDSRVVISSLTATDGLVKEHKPGQLNGQGHVDLKQLFSPFVDIRLDLTNFQVAQSDSFMGKATGPLFLKGEGLKSKVTGEVLLEPAELFLEEAASSDIPTINMVNQRTELKKQDKKTGPQENDSKLFPIELKLNAPKSFKIEGFGLESTWGGTMMVVGTVGDPQLVGMIKIEKGKLDVFGKAMKIKEGSITYKEEPKDDPYLLIYCVRDVDAGTTVTLVIEGFASNPRFTLLSTPALPEEEILSRLLFGKELGKISVGQSLQLATAVAAMNGKKGLNVMDQIRSSFGLDTLELKEQKKADSYDTTGSQAVSIGKEFGNVKISIDQGVSTGTSKATLEAAVSPNLNVDVDVGGDQSSGVGLTWIKRY
jgi:autotransporter translocation and assembly factor TamB